MTGMTTVRVHCCHPFMHAGADRRMCAICPRKETSSKSFIYIQEEIDPPCLDPFNETRLFRFEGGCKRKTKVLSSIILNL